ncbi:MAG TPA: DUF58 domain-containing protein [Burkholderiaceae bacterium]|nr:DUF58 domain-containing protein [Burkholderiaceae bacterium]
MSIAANALVVRIADWIAGRHGPEAGDIALDRRRVYILPTAPGVAFGVVTLILLIGSINYMLQLGYLLTFLVASMAVVGMHSTHSNLAQAVVRGVQVEPVYAGDVAAFEINVTNPTTVDRFALRFSFTPPPERAFLRWFSRAPRERERPTITIELPARGLRTVAVPLPAPIRGRLPAPRITIETRYPFGLWRAWAYLTPALTAMVYPAPEFDAPALPSTGAGTGEAVGMASSGDDFAGVRPYQPGDAQKMIAWKLAARSDELSVKQFEAAGGGELMLDYDQLPDVLGIEGKLSRLTRWVLDADASHMRYGLKLPDAMIFIGSGAAHREHCLTALAVCVV